MLTKNLYIIATPIGNLKDITFRAIEILKEVDVVLCEDTRVSRRLLDHYKINKKTVSLHQHSSDNKIEKMLLDYDNIAYISDAGTPGISDPGGKIVQIASEMEINIVPIPGVSAIITALSVSGLPTDKFTFMGFMPHKGKNKMMEEISFSEKTICFYESPHRILKTLEELKNYLTTDRKVVVGRELTKKFETIYRGNIDEVLDQVKEKPKGEFVVIISAKK